MLVYFKQKGVQMLKRINVLLSSLLCASLILSACSSSSSLATSDSVIEKGADYLITSYSADGSIGSYSDTAWAIMGLVAAGKYNEGFSSPSPIDHLRDNESQMIDSFNLPADLARNTLAIIAAGESPFNFGKENELIPEGNYVQALKNLHDGQQFGPAESINEDFWAVIALIAAGVSPDDEIIKTTTSYIIDCQGNDYGWSWASPDNEWYYESDPDNTAAAIIALVNAGMSSSDEPVQNALDYLKSTQGPNGGFMSYGVENTGSTTWVVSALNILGEDLSSWDNNGATPSNFLINVQNPDGSFSFASPMPEGYLAMSEYNTAAAIIALTGNSYPVVQPQGTKWWLWAGLIIIIVSMVIFLCLNTKRRWK